MTAKETDLLELAKEIIALNSPNYSLAITGSLMLSIRGIDVGREAHDLDFVSSLEFSDVKLILPNGFEQCSRKYPDAVSYQNAEGIKLDFMYSNEQITFLANVPLGDIERLLRAKRAYCLQKHLAKEEIDKHTRDIRLIIAATDPDGSLGYERYTKPEPVKDICL